MKIIFNIILYKGSPPKKIRYCVVCGKYKPESRFKANICDRCRLLKPKQKLNKIIRIVCRYFNIDKELINDNTQKDEVVKYRQIVMYFACLYTNLSLANIGSLVGKKDHSTVSYAKKTVNDLIDTDKSYKHDIDEIDKIIIKKLKL